MFPIPFLKKVFLIWNKIKIETIDKLLYKEYKINADQFLLYRQGFPYREANISIDAMAEGREKDFMRSWSTWTQEEFILVFSSTCWIEPDYGWAVVKPNKLIYYSFGVSRTFFQRKPHLLKLIFRKDIVRVKQAISLRDSGEENYFHFFNDILAKLFFLTDNKIDVQSYPVIVSRKLFEKEYFQFCLKNVRLMQSLKWIVQDKQFIQCDSVIFCKPLTHRLDVWNRILESIPPIEPSMGEKRIFLTRNKSRLRFIENQTEIDKVCHDFKLKMTDTEGLSFMEQISLFSNAELIVGIHGAGLTNMVFSTSRCTVLEIFPPPEYDYLPYHYMMLAVMRGFSYRAIIGEPGKKYSGGFCLSPERLDQELRAIFGEGLPK